MNKILEEWSLEDISMVDKMNFEPNVMQLVILDNMYIVFFIAMWWCAYIIWSLEDITVLHHNFKISNCPPRTSQAFSTQTSTQLYVIDGLFVRNIVLMVMVTTF